MREFRIGRTNAAVISRKKTNDRSAREQTDGQGTNISFRAYGRPSGSYGKRLVNRVIFQVGTGPNFDCKRPNQARWITSDLPESGVCVGGS